MARLRDPKRANQPDGFADIPYADLARSLFRELEQRFIPLLGAGASRPLVTGQTDPSPRIDGALVQELAARLNATSEDSQLFLEIAIAVIGRLNANAAAPPMPAKKAYDAVRDSESAPSAAELAQALAELSSYDYFAAAKRRINQLTGRNDWNPERLTRLLASMARLTGIGSPTPPLLDASSYHAYRKPRDEFWSDLHRLFENKNEPTDTHRLVASAAAKYLDVNRSDSTAADWLVVTTNYDCLMERALDTSDPPVPYYVVTVPTTEPLTVDLRFSGSAQQHLALSDAQYRRITMSARVEPDYEQPKTPLNFVGLTNRPRPLVTIYKIHGSLHSDATADRDGVVITHEDYVEFISVDNRVPGFVRTRLRGSRLLLLGYSFSDWNVRSLYRTMTQYRLARAIRRPGSSAGDYAVLYDPTPYETGFFDANNIDVLDTSLDLFATRIREALGP